MMINREVISKKDLLELFKVEARNLDVCTTIYIGPIKEITTDEDGCNWKLLISGGEEYETKKCAQSLEKLISSLRSKFNIAISQLS